MSIVVYDNTYHDTLTGPIRKHAEILKLILSRHNMMSSLKIRYLCN
jgi:hypothetical protein